MDLGSETVIYPMKGFVLLFEHSELVALAVASTIVYGSSSPSKVGVLILIVAVFLDAGFAAMSRGLVTSIGGSKRLHALSSLISLLLLIPIYMLNFIYYTFTDSRPLILSDLTSIPWLFVSLVFIGGITVSDFYLTSIASARLGPYPVTRLAKLTLTFSAFAICILQSPNQWFAGLPAVFSSVAPIGTPTHQLSTGVLFALVAILYATILLTNTKPGYGPDGSSSGHFIGYSLTGLPLFTAGQTPSHGVRMLSSSKTMGLSYHIRTTLKGIMLEQSSRRIFAFLCLNLTFTFVELLYGVWTNSLGLISDGFHMLFDSAALVVGLYAAVVSRWKPTRLFSYGFHSAEVLSGFVNALFLVVISGSVFVNALARIHRPPEIRTDRLMAVSVAGLLVNLVGILALGHAHSHGGGGHGHSHGGGGHGNSHGGGGHGNSHGGGGHRHSHGESGHKHGDCDHGHNHGAPPAMNNELHYGHAHGHKKHAGESCSHAGGDANLRGVYLHVLADTLGSVGVIFSSYLVSTYGWNIADPICSIFIACAIGCSAMPLLYDTFGLLTLRAPNTDQSAHPESIVQKILALENVQSVYNPFVWSQTRETICLSICVRIDSNVSEQQVLARVIDLVATRCPNVTHLTVQVEKDIVHYHFQAMGLKPNILLEFRKHAFAAHTDDHRHHHQHTVIQLSEKSENLIK